MNFAEILFIDDKVTEEQLSEEEIQKIFDTVLPKIKSRIDKPTMIIISMDFNENDIYDKRK